MDDLCFFYSAKMVIVFFILLLSLATLEAQRNEKDKFFDLMTAIGEDFDGEFNDAEKALELDLNGANAFLERLHKFATREIIRKNENGQFECKEPKKADFKMAIQTILGENMRNLIKAFLEKSSGTQLDTIKTIFGKKLYEKVKNLKKSITVPKQPESVKLSGNQLYTIQTIFDDKSFKKVEDLLKELSVNFSEKKLFNLLFSLAARLEALVHGKNSDGTLKEKEENSKDKIQTFLAVPKCFILPELEELSIFDYWMEIIAMKTIKSQKPIFGVAIYKEKYNRDRWEDSKEEAFKLSRENYKILKQLNDQKFSIYESLNLLRAAFTWGYLPRIIPRGKIPQIFDDLLEQINSVFFINSGINDWSKNYKCAYAMFFQNISESLLKMMSDKGIDPKLHLESIDFKIQKDIQKDVDKSCKKFDNEEAKFIFLNNVHYELVINFEFNQQKEVHDRAKDLLSKWIYGNGNYVMDPLSEEEESYLKKNASQLLHQIKNFTSEKTNRESISIIEALIGKEHIDQFNLGALFDEIKWLVEVAIQEKDAIIAEEMKGKNTTHLKTNLKEQAQTLAKTFEKMLENVKEHYAKKMDE